MKPSDAPEVANARAIVGFPSAALQRDCSRSSACEDGARYRSRHGVERLAPARKDLALLGSYRFAWPHATPIRALLSQDTGCISYLFGARPGLVPSRRRCRTAKTEATVCARNARTDCSTRLIARNSAPGSSSRLGMTSRCRPPTFALMPCSPKPLAVQYLVLPGLSTPTSSKLTGRIEIDRAGIGDHEIVHFRSD